MQILDKKPGLKYNDPNSNKITSDNLKAQAFGEFSSSVFISEDTTSLPSFTLTNSIQEILDIDIYLCSLYLRN